MPDLGNLGAKTNDALRQMAIDMGIKKVPTQRTDLILEVLANNAEIAGELVGAGILDVLGDGYGFLESPISVVAEKTFMFPKARFVDLVFVRVTWLPDRVVHLPKGRSILA